MPEFAYRIGVMLSSYSQAINKANNTTGSVFQQKTKAKQLTEELDGAKTSYLEQCFYYIHQNPIAASLVANLDQWKFSSYPDYSGKRNGTLCNKQLLLTSTGLTIDEIINQSETIIDPDIILKLQYGPGR